MYVNQSVSYLNDDDRGANFNRLFNGFDGVFSSFDDDADDRNLH